MKYFGDRHTCIHLRTILDAGCGNGRDSKCLSTKYKVTGVDNCGININDAENFNFLDESFITVNKDPYDLIYSRFTFHSITNKDHLDFLSSIKPNTYLAIEARSTTGCNKQEYHGKTHYRNYIDITYLQKILVSNKFEILFIKEDNNMAKYKTENPTCVRVICKKIDI